MAAEGEEKLPVRSSLKGNEVGDIFHLVEPRPLNPWAAIGSLAIVSLFVLALIAIPVFQIDPLPKRETLTMLYLPAPPAAGGNATKFQAPPKLRSTLRPTTIAIPIRAQIKPDRLRLRSD